MIGAPRISHRKTRETLGQALTISGAQAQAMRALGEELIGLRLKLEWLQGQLDQEQDETAALRRASASLWGRLRWLLRGR